MECICLWHDQVVEFGEYVYEKQNCDYIEHLKITTESQGINVGQKYEGIIKLNAVCLKIASWKPKAAPHNPWQMHFTYKSKFYHVHITK